MKHFLIADPNSHTRRAFALLLERRLGDCASDVSEAWDRASLESELARAIPDVLVLDCHLPGVRPAEIAQLARRLVAGHLVLMSMDIAQTPGSAYNPYVILAADRAPQPSACGAFAPKTGGRRHELTRTRPYRAAARSARPRALLRAGH